MAEMFECMSSECISVEKNVEVGEHPPPSYRSTDAFKTIKVDSPG